MLAAAFSGIVWCLLDYRLERKYSMVGFCSGTIAGLVAATPASGFIHPWAAVIMGVISGAVCNYATKAKALLRMDDALDLFAEHAVGGIIGLLMNAFFASKSIIALDGVNTNITGGWIDHNWKQLYIQVAYICATCSYSFVVTALIAKCVDLIPGLHLRTTPEGEAAGLDEVEIGEFANDYIEVRRDFMAWSALDDHPGAHKAGAAGDRHGQPDLAQVDQLHRVHLGEPDSSTIEEEKSVELPRTDAESL